MALTIFLTEMMESGNLEIWGERFNKPKFPEFNILKWGRMENIGHINRIHPWGKFGVGKFRLFARRTAYFSDFQI